MITILNFFLRLIALIGLMLISPLLIICSILIVIENGFPVIFLQKRLGKNMKVFKIIKIRTMKKGTPNVGTHENIDSDFLRIGLLIRKFKLDEFPQLVNYILGSINLVGPRPGLPNQVELKSARDQRNIFNVKPGITGLSQVLGYDMSNPELLSKVDAIYIKHYSILLDITIFFATFLHPLRKMLHNRFELDINEVEIIKNV
tara:strand:- start:41 stop:646 length:606 start_codon:yes stop_codon:yes gene_type:complete